MERPSNFLQLLKNFFIEIYKFSSKKFSISCCAYLKVKTPVSASSWCLSIFSRLIGLRKNGSFTETRVEIATLLYNKLCFDAEKPHDFRLTRTYICNGRFTASRRKTNFIPTPAEQLGAPRGYHAACEFRRKPRAGVTEARSNERKSFSGFLSLISLSANPPRNGR